MASNGFQARLMPELTVTNVMASRAFWCSLLGFAVEYDRPAGGFAYITLALHV